ncbi:MAG: hypothetical protein KGO49_00950 [Gammaproteobacteria bacterium]|nr:hypothetical protein [Gammaproteobacteria bacterium]
MVSTKESSDKHYFITTDMQSGQYLFKKISRTVRFSADDFEEFSEQFRRMIYELGLWKEHYGRKANELNLVIEAHPWILKRVRDHLAHPFPAGHPYGDFARKHPISIHLYDQLDHKGQHYKLANGKLSITRAPSSESDTPND